MVNGMKHTSTRYGPWEKLLIMRRRSGIRQGDLAAHASISRPHLANLESGKRWPTPAITQRLADGLGVPAAMIAREDRDSGETPEGVGASGAA